MNLSCHVWIGGENKGEEKWGENNGVNPKVFSLKIFSPTCDIREKIIL